MSTIPLFRPKLLDMLRGYTRAHFVSDLMAGLIVGVVAIPLAIAFGIASGVTPQQGLFTAVVAGFLISALGGSRVQIGGPTGAFVVIIYGIVQEHGVNGLMVATLMAGAILIVMGLARLGSLIRFIPHPLVVGFTSGIAVIIFSSQVKDFLGLPVDKMPAEFLGKWTAIARNMTGVSPWTLAVGASCLVFMVVWQRFIRKVPAPLVALVFSTAAVAVFHLPVATISTHYGQIPSMLPAPALPHVQLAELRVLVQPALTIAILGAIEALLSAVVADGMTGGRHRSDTELIGQGIANLVSPLFGGIPATGAIARTATNVKNGGRTPMAGMVHALVVLLTMMFFAKWAGQIPMACLAAILFVVSYNMSEWRSFAKLLRGPRGDIGILLSTFFLTVLVDLTVAIEVGLVLSAFLFLRKMSESTQVESISGGEPAWDDQSDPDALALREVPSSIRVFEVNGPFFFGTTHKFEEAMKAMGAAQPKALIIRMRFVPMLDATGLHAIEGLLKDCRKKGTALILSGVQEGPLRAMVQSGFIKVIGHHNVKRNIDEALQRARQVLGLPPPGPPKRPADEGLYL